MNYYGDPHDLDVMVAVVRKALEVVDNWPGTNVLGPVVRAAGSGQDPRPPGLATLPSDDSDQETSRDTTRSPSIT